MKAFRDMNMPSLVSPFSVPATWMFRAFVFIMGFPVYRTNIEQNKKTRELFQRLIQVAAEHGWGEYRTAPAFQQQVTDALLLEQPRATAFARNTEGCGGPQRDHLRRPLRDLAKKNAGAEKSMKIIWALIAVIGVLPMHAAAADAGPIEEGQTGLPVLVLELSRRGTRQARYAGFGGQIQRLPAGDSRSTNRSHSDPDEILCAQGSLHHAALPQDGNHRCPTGRSRCLSGAKRCEAERKIAGLNAAQQRRSGTARLSGSGANAPNREAPARFSSFPRQAS